MTLELSQLLDMLFVRLGYVDAVIAEIAVTSTAGCAWLCR